MRHTSSRYRDGSAVRRAAVLLLVGWILPPAASSQNGPSPFDPTLVYDEIPARAVTTHHGGTFNGIALEFDVVTEETALQGDDGMPAATIFSTSYLRTSDVDPAARPVLFLFNGGPGASSSPLHLGIGPVRRSPDPDAGALIVNDQSILDATDMVFVDPVGTGYARIMKDDAGGAFWGIEEDADAVLQMIGQWLKTHDRQSSPVFLMGESYGGTRAIAMLARSESVRFAGILLLSPAIDYSRSTPVVGNNLPFIYLLPGMAATAAYHGVTPTDGLSLTAVFERAAVYAQADFAAALFQGNQLSEEDRRATAEELSRLTGLSRDFVLEQNLRIDRNEFSLELLADEGLRTGMLDARQTGNIEEFRDRRPPYNDPGMSGGGGGQSTGSLLRDYFRDQLDTDIDRPYRTLNLDVNSRWNYELGGGRQMYVSVAPLLEQALQDDAGVRVFIGGGLFDLVTPIMAARYVASQLDVSPARFTFGAYEAGHTVFEHEESRIRLGHDVRWFIAGATAAVTDR